MDTIIHCTPRPNIPNGSRGRKDPVLRNDGRGSSPMGATLRSETSDLPFLLREMPRREFKEGPVVLMPTPKRRRPKVAPADAQYTCPIVHACKIDPRRAPPQGAWPDLRHGALNRRFLRMSQREPETDFTRRMWISAALQPKFFWPPESS